MEAFKCGYCTWFFATTCENYLEHSCFKNCSFNNEEHQLVADENSVVTVVGKDGTVITPKTNVTDVNELIITLVSQRKPLYDPSVKISERTNFKKNGLWSDVKRHLGSAMTIVEIKACWKYLRDCYIKARKKVMEYKPSGGEADAPTKPGFRFYENMTFLNDTLERKSVVCSVSQVEPGSPSPSSSSVISESQTPRSNIKKRKAEETKELHQAMLKVLSDEPKPIKGLDGFILRIREGLARLDYRERSKLEIKFLQTLQEAEEKSQQIN